MAMYILHQDGFSHWWNELYYGNRQSAKSNNFRNEHAKNDWDIVISTNRFICLSMTFFFLNFNMFFIFVNDMAFFSFSPPVTFNFSPMFFFIDFFFRLISMNARVIRAIMAVFVVRVSTTTHASVQTAGRELIVMTSLIRVLWRQRVQIQPIATRRLSNLSACELLPKFPQNSKCVTFL